MAIDINRLPNPARDLVHLARNFVAKAVPDGDEFVVRGWHWQPDDHQRWGVVVEVQWAGAPGAEVVAITSERRAFYANEAERLADDPLAPANVRRLARSLLNQSEEKTDE